MFQNKKNNSGRQETTTLRRQNQARLLSLLAVAALTSCSLQLPFQPTNPQKNTSKYQLNGTVEFPKVNNKFTAKATLEELGNRATVSVIYPSDHPTKPNETIAVGLTNSTGNFSINFDNVFDPAVGEVFELEASKRNGTTGNDLMTIRTNLKWNGTDWDSMTYPALKINTKTTALAIIDSLNDIITAADTINTIDTSSGSSVPGDVVGSANKLLFYSDQDSSYQEIYVIDADGSNQVRLTNNSADDYDPHWAPGGNKIVFVSKRDGNDEIYTMDVDGSNQTRLTTNGSIDSGPVYAPSGDKIAFSAYRDGNSEVYVMDADGSNQTNISNNASPDSDPRWSPNSTQLLFVSSRDGNLEVYVMDADGSNQSNISNHSSIDYDPQWSPDGSKIMFVSNRDGNNEIYVFDSQSNLTNLTNNAASDDAPRWSPDGTKIIFYSNRDINREIYIMNADGSNQTKLTNNSATDFLPEWSYDSNKIAFRSLRDGNYEIYTMDPDGSNQTNLSNNAGDDFFPQWRPDILVKGQTVLDVADIVNRLISIDLDPLHYIAYENRKYFVQKKVNPAVQELLATKLCPNCDLSYEDLSNQNLVGGDLSNTNLRGANLSFTNLDSANLYESTMANTNLISANLGGVFPAELNGIDISNADFSFATWTDGTLCRPGSIGACLPPLDELHITDSYVTGYQANPSVASDANGGFVVVWQGEGTQDSYGIYGQRYNSYAEKIDDVFLINNSLAGNQSNPSISMNATGKFVVAWQDSNNDTYVKLYDTDGTSLTGSLKANTTSNNTLSNVSPDVAMDGNGNFMVVWSYDGSVGDASDAGILAQRYDSSGSTIGSEMQVSYANYYRTNSVIDMNTSGEFVIGWESQGQDTSGAGIYAKKFDSSATALGLELRVNDTVSGEQVKPDIAINSQGEFIVTYLYDNQIFAKRYTSTGTPNGSQVVNTLSDAVAGNKAVVTYDNYNEDIVICWESLYLDGSTYGIYTKKFDDPSGSEIVVDYQVNDYTTGAQQNPAIAIDQSGNYIIAWESYNQEADTSYGIYARRYNDNASSL